MKEGAPTYIGHCTHKLCVRSGCEGGGPDVHRPLYTQAVPTEPVEMLYTSYARSMCTCVRMYVCVSVFIYVHVVVVNSLYKFGG